MATTRSWLSLTEHIAEATRDIRKIELRPGYGYDPFEKHICDAHRDIVKDRFYPRFPGIAAVRLEKRDGRPIWARKDFLLAIAHRGWPKSQCWMCGVKIPCLWVPTPSGEAKWCPDLETESFHALTKKDKKGRGFLCYEELIQEKPPNVGYPRRIAFSDAILELDTYADDVPCHLNYSKAEDL